MNFFPYAFGVEELGSAPKRFFEFGTAPALTSPPYATWQTVSRVPENMLDGAPAFDRVVVQIDVWAATGTEARSIAQQLRQALQAVGYITAWRESPQEAETHLHRVSFDLSTIEEL